jgi:hypothetical protein
MTSSKFYNVEWKDDKWMVILKGYETAVLVWVVPSGTKEDREQMYIKIASVSRFQTSNL